MTVLERLLIPAWDAPTRSIEDWCVRLGNLGHPPALLRERPDEIWLHVESLGLRMMAVEEGPTLAALHAELEAPDPGTALELLHEAATGLGWEIHDEDDGDAESR